MALQDAWGFDGKTYSGQEMRLQVAALTGGRGGVSTTTDMVATPQGSPNNTVSVSAGTAIIPATHAGDLGSYEVPNDAALASPAFAAAGGSGRRDLLILQVIAGVPQLVIVQGTPAGSPVYPSLAGLDNYIVICGVLMPAGKSIIDNGGVNGSIEDRRSLWAPYVVCTSTTRPPIPFDGQQIYEIDTDKRYVWDSVGWIDLRSPDVVTSGTRPTGNDRYTGREIIETDTWTKQLWDGTRWVQLWQRDASTYTPAVKNSGQAAVSKTVTYAKYVRVGKRIRLTVRLDITSNSAGTGTILVDLPVDAAQDAVFVGTGAWYDASINTGFSGEAITVTSTTPDTLGVIRDNNVGEIQLNSTLGTGDFLMYEVEYEAASF